MFSLYLFVAINYCGDLFGCQLQRLLNESYWAKHLVAYLTLLFFAILSSDVRVPGSRAFRDRCPCQGS